MKAVPLFRRTLVLTFALAAMIPNGNSAQGNYVNFEGKQTNPARLSPDGTRLFAVNTPDARLSVFDVTHPSNPVLIAEIPVGVEPVSVNPRTSDEAWVVNEVSDSISIVSVSQGIVTDTIYVPDEPADVVFAGGRAFVTSARKNTVVVFDATDHSQLASIPVFGENPRALVVNGAGTKVYAAFAISGNRTTIIPAEIAPAQSPPTNTELPNPPKVSRIVDALDPDWAHFIKFKMPDNDIVEIDVSGMSITRYYTNVGTINLGIAVRPDNGDLYVANTDARNLVRLEPNVRGNLVTNRVTQVNLATGARTFHDLNPGVNFGTLPNHPARAEALAQPTAIVFEPGGSYFYVAAFGTDRIARVANNGVILDRIEVSDATGATADPRHKRGPRGLALNAATERLYVLNRISNTLTLINTADNTVLKEIPVGSHDPTPAVIREGRGFLYDAKLSGNGNASCATCHVDSEMDMLAWDLGDPAGTMRAITLTLTNGVQFAGTQHPMKGPLMTQTFRGLKGNEPFHWRADRTNFLEFNTTFNTLLGGDTMDDVGMQAFSDFIDTVTFQPNPHQNLDRTLPTSLAGGNAQQGLIAFQTPIGSTAACTICHEVPPGAGSRNQIVPAGEIATFQSIKLPHLRNVYKKLNMNNADGAESIAGFGLMHDGVRPGIDSFLQRDILGDIPPATRADLAAFIMSWDNGMAPAVGYTRTARSSNVSSTGITDDWTLLEGQAAANNLDLVVKGSIDGKPTGFVYQPGSDNYLPDTMNAAPFTRSQLVTKVQGGDTLTLMGVPPGSGMRMGVDRDLDGTLDGDVPPPKVDVDFTDGKLVIRWPYGATGFALETTATLAPPSWTVVTTPLEIGENQNLLTNSPAGGSGFFRLKSQ